MQVEITTPYYPSLKDVSIKCPAQFHPLLVPLRDQAEGSSLLNLLRSMSHAIKSKTLFVAESLDIDKQKLETFIVVLKELESLGRENVVNFDHEQMTVTLATKDSRGETHEINVQFHSDYPVTGITVKKIDLPKEAISSLEGSSSFKPLYDSFTEAVEGLVPFWEAAEELERECWVIDPETPSRKDTYRRIFLTTDLSVSVMFDALRMNEMPEIIFFGCVSAVEQRRSEFMSKLETQGWNFESSVVFNLKRLLDVDTFPRKPSPTENVQDPLECLICASNGIEEGAPAQKWCNNEKCPSVYHRSCLYRWFDGLQTAKQYWDYICGPCPYCKAKVWCPMKEDVPAKS